MFISKKQAIKKLRADAGYTIEAATEEVSKLRAKTFGKREKVKAADLDSIIAEANKPSPPVEYKHKIRPFRRELREQFERAAARR